jgi:phage replication-related protein YjqB (UPF0714/DUF867 family)
MNSMEMPKQSTYAAFGSLSPEFEARILKLRLPEQDALKNAPERCSADPVMLESIGRCIGQQVRIRRRDDPRFAALFTAKQANPDVRGRANVIRAGLTGRQRLGSAKEMPAIVQAQVVDPGPQPDGVSFFEVAHDDGKQAYFIAIAPHGGEIETHTDEQAELAVRKLTTDCFPASLWLCKGDGDKDKGAFDRWHITADDLQPACFPLLEPLVSRGFCYGVAFHGFDRKKGEADVYIGGAASRPLKVAIERALIALYLPIKIKISTRYDDPKFQGFSPENIINRLTTRGIQLEQSIEARKYYREIACAVAKVFASHLRFLVCIFINDLETERIKREAEFFQALSKDLAWAPPNVGKAIEDYTAWKAVDRVLAAKVKTAEELESFDELEKHASLSAAESKKKFATRGGIPILE